MFKNVDLIDGPCYYTQIGDSRLYYNRFVVIFVGFFVSFFCQRQAEALDSVLNLRFVLFEFLGLVYFAGDRNDGGGRRGTEFIAAVQLYGYD